MQGIVRLKDTWGVRPVAAIPGSIHSSIDQSDRLLGVEVES
jgi:hypothetical protein